MKPTDPPSKATAPLPRPPAYATLAEATAYTRLSPKTLQRAAGAGKLKRHRVGSRLLFAYDELDRFVVGSPSVPGEVATV